MRRHRRTPRYLNQLSCTLCSLVGQIRGFDTGYCKPGKQAIRGRDRGKINAKAGASIAASADLDKGLKRAHPNDPRWDYGICVHRNGGEAFYWVEVHPATSSEVQAVIKKFAWLQNLLRAHPGLRKRTAREHAYRWIPANGVHIIPAGQRRIVQAGIRLGGGALG